MTQLLMLSFKEVPMDEKIIEIIKKDIKRCESQTVNEGSYQLYQALMGKYNGIFQGFSNDIP